MGYILKWRMRCTIILFAFIFMPWFLTACTAPAVSRDVEAGAVALPDEARLRARLAEFHSALGANDITRWYAMTTPTIRSKMTFEQFKKDLRWDENASGRKESVMQGDLGRVCSCVPMEFLRCVLIVNVTTRDADGRVQKERPLETWEYADGDWYWGYMGPESRGQCPGER